MLADTHVHLNFNRFKKNVDEIMAAARKAGVGIFVVPGTDVKSSQRAIELAHVHGDVWAAVGIHPHHVFELREKGGSYEAALSHLSHLAEDKRVVAIGEIGLDRHHYTGTKYEAYKVDEPFMKIQEQLFTAQLELALTHDKAVIIHNREAKQHMLPLLEHHWDDRFRHRMVFHCCEPDEELLSFARTHNIFIGVDGDVTYWPEKQAFIKKVPLDILVLETDAPFLLPEPLKSQKLYPNTPANLSLIAAFIADLYEETKEKIIEATCSNAQKLFMLSR